MGFRQPFCASESFRPFPVTITATRSWLPSLPVWAYLSNPQARNACGLAEHPAGAGQQPHGLKYLVVRYGDHIATGVSDGPKRLGPVSRFAHGYAVGQRVGRFLFDDVFALFKGLVYGTSAFCLNTYQLGDMTYQSDLF